MEKKVSADTVTEISAAAAFRPELVGTPPTADELIAQIREHLTTLVEKTDKKLHPYTYQGAKGKQHALPSHGEAVRDQQEFEKIIADIPVGFRLAPVFYTKTKFDQNDDVYDEFEMGLRAEFLRYLATQHADELTRLGVCDAGIALMKEGKEPKNDAGSYYDINVDHIIERGGSGTMGTTRDFDPERPAGSQPSYLVNHFSNFILLPVSVHNIKNQLNALQRASETPVGQAKWILMLVPDSPAPGFSGYVAKPQDETDELGATTRNLQTHYVNPLSSSEAIIHRVHDMLQRAEEKPEQKEKLDAYIASSLDEAADRLRAAFNKAAQPKGKFPPFKKFYESDDFRTLRRDLDKVPPQDAWKVRKVIKEIDEGVAARFNRHAPYRPPANENKPDAAPDWTNPQPHKPHRQKQRGKKKHHR